MKLRRYPSFLLGGTAVLLATLHLQGQVIIIDDFQNPGSSAGVFVDQFDRRTETQFGVAGAISSDRSMTAEIGTFDPVNAFAASSYDSVTKRAVLAANGGDDGTDFGTRLSWGEFFPIAQPNFSSVVGTDFDFVLSVPELTGAGNFDFCFVFLYLNSGSGAQTREGYAFSDIVLGSNLTYKWNSSLFPEIDFSDVSFVQLSVASILNPGNHFSLSVSDFRAVAVPEPREYAAGVGIGLMAFALWRRRLSRR